MVSANWSILSFSDAAEFRITNKKRHVLFTFLVYGGAVA
jgi:hypothetical protein